MALVDTLELEPVLRDKGGFWQRGRCKARPLLPHSRLWKAMDIVRHLVRHFISTGPLSHEMAAAPSIQH